MNLTLGQKLALVIATLGALSVAGTQLTELVGAAGAKSITAASGLGVSILSGWMAVLFGQGNQIAAVRQMPGVENILVNEKANSTLATMAMDPTETKIVVIPAAENAVQATANAAS